MQFNQTNNNKGAVNNAISEKGNVVQATGSAHTGDVTAAASENGSIAQTSGAQNRVQMDDCKRSFWSELRRRLSSAWKWISGLFTGVS